MRVGGILSLVSIAIGWCIKQQKRRWQLKPPQQMCNPPQDVNAGDAEKRTPLHWAAGMGHAEIASMLMKEGAALENADSKGNTPLMYAGESRDESTSIRRPLRDGKSPQKWHACSQLLGRRLARAAAGIGAQLFGAAAAAAGCRRQTTQLNLTHTIHNFTTQPATAAPNWWRCC